MSKLVLKYSNISQKIDTLLDKKRFYTEKIIQELKKSFETYFSDFEIIPDDFDVFKLVFKDVKDFKYYIRIYDNRNHLAFILHFVDIDLDKFKECLKNFCKENSALYGKINDF